MRTDCLGTSTTSTITFADLCTQLALEEHFEAWDVEIDDDSQSIPDAKFAYSPDDKPTTTWVDQMDEDDVHLVHGIGSHDDAVLDYPSHTQTTSFLLTVHRSSKTSLLIRRSELITRDSDHM